MRFKISDQGLARVRGRSYGGQVNISCMSGEHQLNVKSQSELDIGGRETCLHAIIVAL